MRSEHRRVETARTLLFVPADHETRSERALASDADAVIFDLEDAVAPDSKEEARACLGAIPGERDGGPLFLVRVNAPSTAEGALDLEALCRLERPVHAVVVPKASPASLALAAAAVPFALVALVETAEAVLHAERLAREPGVARLMFGPYDLSAELGCEPGSEGDELLLARSQLVLASAAARIAAPIDGPFTALGNDDRLRAETERARRLGYTAKTCIHPRQLATVKAGLAPRREQVEWARRVVDAYDGATAHGSGAIALDGEMIDEPMARRAHAILDRSGEQE